MTKNQIVTVAEGKSRKLAQKVTALATAGMMMVKYPYLFFATGNTQNNSGFGGISVSVPDDIASQFGNTNAVMGMVISLALWICQITGVGMLIWGIYGYVTARKDGEAEAMNGALGKLISGAVLIGMKGILMALGIVTG